MYSYGYQYHQYSPRSFNLLNFGVLAFVTTIILPMNLGLAKLPIPIVIVIFVSGFASLFLLAKEIDKTKGTSMDNNINKENNLGDRKLWGTRLGEKSRKDKFQDNEEIQIPFDLVKHNIENLLYSYGDILDQDTRHKLVRLCRKLEDANE